MVLVQCFRARGVRVVLSSKDTQTYPTHTHSCKLWAYKVHSGKEGEAIHVTVKTCNTINT